MGAAKTGETAAAVAGGGALGSADAVKTLADAGITVISSTHARGVLPDSHRASLRAFHNSPSVEALIAQCDFTLVAGSRLRSNETRSRTLELPSAGADRYRPGGSKP